MATGDTEKTFNKIVTKSSHRYDLRFGGAVPSTDWRPLGTGYGLDGP